MSFNKKSYINISDGKEVIKLISKIGMENGTKVWLQFGTLLGHVRDGGFILHDRDIDLGIEYRYWNNNISLDLKKLGFIVMAEARFTETSFLKFVGANKKNALGKMRLKYKDISICFDIFHEGVDEYKNYMYSCQPKEKKYLIELPKNLLVPQVKTMFYDVDVWLPENYMGFIKRVYGESWQKSIDNYIGSNIHKKNSKKFRRRT